MSSNRRQYFGTDGIRGKANTPPMTADMALRVAMATAYVLRAKQKGNVMNRAVIGKDTRLSGYMLEQAMASGFVAMGMEVIFTGPVPTPAIAMLTRSLRADIGVMISASHNPYQDNGIKLFGSDGYKLSDALELEIESALEMDQNELLPSPDLIGKAFRIDDAGGRYIEFLKGGMPKGESLKGLRIVVDGAHGAAYKIAPQLLWELEADVVSIGDRPDGRNINDGFGATDVANLQKKVVEEKADLGIALDGDADRLIMVDETGRKIDGDQLMALLAVSMKERGALAHDTLVTTVMSNLGLERFLESKKIKLERTAVGDRYVVERMRSGGFNLGGEQSGHIILSDFGTTGDGLLAAMQVLGVIQKSGKKASEVCKLFEPLPQLLKNVRFDPSKKPLDDESVKSAIGAAEKTLLNNGRLLIRKSGTEPLIRVMAEGDDEKKIQKIVGDLCDVIEKAAG
ncbi:MAG: phosphoglucosamine mutase [Micavibrio aeruginosavorus]|uniref:Phosphoglucosamine mutase n=1 Tax=Micavibrio aeruginosavorus TaxID=349221 RepID=A0A2W5NAH0_9BACT|nr:MAG: phosphoglucosamine mutase [Micavibrio aeruginosavorus]